MVLISFTNVVVDEFSYGKRNPLKKYIYFLTHMHSDHYQGISPNWNYGPIYCSKVTKKLLLLKFPRLPDVVRIILWKSERLQLLCLLSCFKFLFFSLMILSLFQARIAHGLCLTDMSAWGEQNRDYGLFIWCQPLPRYCFIKSVLFFLRRNLH